MSVTGSAKKNAFSIIPVPYGVIVSFPVAKIYCNFSTLQLNTPPSTSKFRFNQSNNGIYPNTIGAAFIYAVINSPSSATWMLSITSSGADSTANALNTASSALWYGINWNAIPHDGAVATPEELLIYLFLGVLFTRS